MGVTPVLRHIVQRYRTSHAGKRSTATRDLIFIFHKLLEEADCRGGTARYEAVQELELLAQRGILILKRDRLDSSSILEVRLPVGLAPALFDYLGESAPHAERESLSITFRNAAEWLVGDAYQSNWKSFCLQTAEAAQVGNSIKPFDRTKPDQVAIILQALPKILTWEGDSLLRFASSVIYGNSKTLESYRSQIEVCLNRITDGKRATLSDFGIIENERSFLIHGPLSLLFGGEKLNLGILEQLSRIGSNDIRRAQIETQASRCLTVENNAMLAELAKLKSGMLLASSGSEGGYANSAVVEFLKKLPLDMELWHFGDSDPKGFDILRDLRERTRREIQSLHMRFYPIANAAPLSQGDHSTISRLLSSEYLTDAEKLEIRKIGTSGTKGAFEQEHLGRPGDLWPFY